MRIMILPKQNPVHFVRFLILSQLLLFSAGPAQGHSFTEREMCFVDHLRISKVIERAETIQIPPLSHELSKSEQAYVYKTKYKISKGTFVGDEFTTNENKQDGNIDLSYYSVAYLNLEFIGPETGIENKLEIGKEYVFFVAKNGSRESFEIRRVEPVGNKNEILRVFKERKCR